MHFSAASRNFSFVHSFDLIKSGWLFARSKSGIIVCIFICEVKEEVEFGVCFYFALYPNWLKRFLWHKCLFLCLSFDCSPYYLKAEVSVIVLVYFYKQFFFKNIHSCVNFLFATPFGIFAEVSKLID